MNLNKFIDVTDYPSLQDAVNAAAESSPLGGTVFIPPGVDVKLSRPVILPRTDLTPINVVKIVGGDRYTSRIVGTREFPAFRALIEWKKERKRTWEQKIANLTLELPDVNGVKAINYHHLGERTEEDYSSERLQIDLENLLIKGSNSHHEVLIDLEASVFFSNFNNILGDNSPRSNPIHDTILLRTPTEHTGKNGKIPLGDTPGISFSSLSNLHGPIRRGGILQMFKGRLVGTTFSNSFCNGGAHNPSFEFINCQASQLMNLGTEGRGEKPIVKMTACVFVQVGQLGLGTPNDEYESGIGNGLELYGCEDCVFDTRLSLPSKPVFSDLGVKVIVIDETSKRNKFVNWGFSAVDGDISKEVEIRAPLEHGNVIKGVDVRSGNEQTIP
jgi:hypothetical protein